MDGKVVVVTGASGALGKVVAEAALARGAKVAGVDHAASQIPATGDRIELGGVDLSDAAQAKKAIDAAAAQFGRLDALIQYRRRLCVRDRRRWRSKNLAAHVRDQPSHRAERVAIGTAASRGFPLCPDRQCRRDGCAAGRRRHGPLRRVKAGVHRLTEALAAEWKGKITVNAVLPSIIDTAANRASMPKADFSTWVTPQELAEVVLFLASDAASAVTGALLPVNGRV
jgi:3-oxoacyl-[acyl-carrier protein] reductase